MRVYSEFRSVFSDAEHRYKLDGIEIDVYLPSIALGIEVDGYPWHHGKELKDQKKTERLAEKGVLIVRLRDEKLSAIPGPAVIFDSRKDLTIEVVKALMHTVLNSLDSARTHISSNDVRRIQKYLLQTEFLNTPKYNKMLASLPSPKPGQSFADKHPQAAAEWHPVKNGLLLPSDFFPTSKASAWWVCSVHGGYEMALGYRANGCGCPFCSSKRVCDLNSFSVNLPDVAKDWHPTKNDRAVNEFTVSSGYAAWWLCENGHEQRVSIASRVKNGCPFCSGKKLHKNDSFGCVHPDLIQYWDFSKNSEDIFAISARYKKAVWWLCSEGHEFQRKIRIQIKNAGACSVCAEKKRLESHNFAVIRPQEASLWHPNKNTGLSPHDVFPSSSLEVWWCCETGHEWMSPVKYAVVCEECYKNKILARIPELKAAAGHQLSRSDGCPLPETKHEDEICRFDVNDVGNPSNNSTEDTARRRRPFISLVAHSPHLLPDWHTERNSDLSPHTISYASTQPVWWLCSQNHEWSRTAHGRTSGDDGCPACLGRITVPTSNVAYVYPHLVDEWHYIKNGEKTPYNISFVSKDRQIWWKAKCGHEWQMSVHDRINKRLECIHCLHLSDVRSRSIAVLFPHLMEEWHPDNLFKPEDVLPMGDTVILWRCKEGHEWRTPIKSRTKGLGCSLCSNRKAHAEYNIEKLYPDIARQLHPTKNGGAIASEIAPGTAKKYWWILPCGHECYSEVRTRTGHRGKSENAPKRSKCNTCYKFV